MNRADLTDEAVFITEITVIDPDSNAPVDVCIYKDTGSGGMFGIDSSFVVQENPKHVKSMFNPNITLMLVGD